jgi:hypothetical protein
MTRLARLFREGHKQNPQDNGQLARSRAAGVLRGSGIVLATDSDQLSVQDGAVVGVAFYSLPDLELLDDLAFDRHVLHSETIVVFDVLSCKKMADFERWIPSIGPVYQTPVVGVWQDGLLVDVGVGKKAREILSNRYGLQVPSR